jgi:hypothetical protein
MWGQGEELVRNSEAAVKKNPAPGLLSLCLQKDCGIGLASVTGFPSSKKENIHYSFSMGIR